MRRLTHRQNSLTPPLTLSTTERSESFHARKSSANTLPYSGNLKIFSPNREQDFNFESVVIEKLQNGLVLPKYITPQSAIISTNEESITSSSLPTQNTPVLKALFNDEGLLILYKKLLMIKFLILILF